MNLRKKTSTPYPKYIYFQLGEKYPIEFYNYRACLNYWLYQARKDLNNLFKIHTPYGWFIVKYNTRTARRVLYEYKIPKEFTTPKFNFKHLTYGKQN